MGKDNDVLDCVRTQHKYWDDNLYGILTFDKNGNPYAIQFSISGAVINQDLRVLSSIDALARMTTLALREHDLDYVIAGLLNCSRVSFDLPGIIADILINHAGPNIFREEREDVRETGGNVETVGSCTGDENKRGTAPEVCG